MKVNVHEPIELVYVPENRVIVSFPEGLTGKAHFHPDAKHIEGAMRGAGVAIPVAFRGEFPELADGGFAIHLDDPSFGRAFYEYYYLWNMDRNEFKWREINVHQRG